MTYPLLALIAALTHSAWAASPSPWLDFGLSSGAISSICSQATVKADERLSQLAKAESEPTFENRFVVFSDILSDLTDETAGPAFLGEVSTDPGVRDSGRACDERISRYLVGVFAREDVYKTLKAYSARGPKHQGEDARLIQKTLLAFKRNGLELTARRRGEVRELKEKIVGLETEYRTALGEERGYALFASTELAGLPEDFIARLGRENGYYRVSLDYPDYYPFIDNAKDPEARRRLEFLFSNRGGEANTRRLKEVLRLRARVASLLGYPSHAHYALEERMAKEPKQVLAFLERLKEKLDRKAKPELQTLLELKKEELGPGDDGVIRAWDWRYYHNQLMKSRYQVDEQKIKEYFPMETVTRGMLDVYQQLLGLRFVEIDSADAWHPDVKLFRVDDSSTSRTIAHFYMDLFPRAGKYKHAACFTLVQGRRLPDGSYQRPVSAVVANFNKPTPQAPSLLTHREVETYFHEFGHVMHQVLTTAKYERFSGTSVARDFVEAASQMLENWVWQEAVLQRLSGHYTDGSRKLPAELLEKMLAAKNVDIGLKELRQAFFARVDMEYHLRPPEDPNAVWAEFMEKISLIPMSPGTHPEAGFGHLMGGYDAGYYGYLWSKVYAQDMFSLFEKEGILNPELGRRYRTLILEPGGSIEESVSLRRFLGREPNDEAFFKSIGL